MPFKNKNWIIKKAWVFSSRNKMDQTVKGQDILQKSKQEVADASNKAKIFKGQIIKE